MPRATSTTSVRPSINVTPLVDVVLVLLIIFMVIAPSLHTDAVHLPTTDDPADRSDDGRKIEVVLGAGGSIWIDGEPTSAERFRDEIRDASRGREDWQVVVKGDATLTFGEVQRAMLAIEAAGFPGVGLIADPREARLRMES